MSIELGSLIESWSQTFRNKGPIRFNEIFGSTRYSHHEASFARQRPRHVRTSVESCHKSPSIVFDLIFPHIMTFCPKGIHFTSRGLRAAFGFPCPSRLESGLTPTPPLPK